MFWGISPALDLQEEYFQNIEDKSTEINILLVGSCDARHILKTLAQSYRHNKKQINIYVIEGCLELIARQLLLLSIALENPENLGLLEKTRLFLEIYGNTLLRPSSSKYMITKSKQIIEMITNLEYMSKITPIISFYGLKYCERDYLEMLIQFWAIGNTNQFNICELWDKRLRNALGPRYDSKKGVIDWDYNMRLRDLNASIISYQEYEYFRLTGLSFTWLETEFSRPNNTFAAGVIKSGDNFQHRGYIGDIVIGPHIAYGLYCEDKEMLQKTSNCYKKRSTDISERNIMRLFYELQYKETFKTDYTKGLNDLNLGMVNILQNDAKMSSECDTDNNCSNNYTNSPSLLIEHAEISFHSPTALKTYPLKNDYQMKFDVMFVSHNFLQNLDQTVFKMLKNNALVIFEMRTFLLDNKKDDIKSFAEKNINIAKNNNCIPIDKFKPLEHSIVKFKYVKNNQ